MGPCPNFSNKMKKYISPLSCVFEMETGNSILASSNVEIGGETDHLDAPHKGMGSEDWADGSEEYWSNK